MIHWSTVEYREKELTILQNNAYMVRSNSLRHETNDSLFFSRKTMAVLGGQDEWSFILGKKKKKTLVGPATRSGMCMVAPDRIGSMSSVVRFQKTVSKKRS